MPLTCLRPTLNNLVQNSPLDPLPSELGVTTEKIEPNAIFVSQGCVISDYESSSTILDDGVPAGRVAAASGASVTGELNVPSSHAEVLQPCLDDLNISEKSIDPKKSPDPLVDASMQHVTPVFPTSNDVSLDVGFPGMLGEMFAPEDVQLLSAFAYRHAGFVLDVTYPLTYQHLVYEQFLLFYKQLSFKLFVHLLGHLKPLMLEKLKVLSCFGFKGVRFD
ncbi:hypothetical protein SESBI_01108 [Sesbania bispinosa]|nr:hypothetical protein SESBI_01108 [Sesbania bispinosa]